MFRFFFFQKFADFCASYLLPSASIIATIALASCEFKPVPKIMLFSEKDTHQQVRWGELILAYHAFASCGCCNESHR